jgi:hypothetical protein
MAAQSEEIPRENWRTHFDEFSKTTGTAEVTIEIAGSDIGDQIAAERLVLTGITYDDKDDIVVVAVHAPGADREDYEHIIDTPQQIQVTTLDGEWTFDVVDGEDRQNLIHVRLADELPPPS